MGWVRGALDARLPRAGPGSAAALYGVLVTFGVLLLFIFVATFFDEGERNDSDLEPMVGVFVVAMGVATLTLWWLRVTERLDVRWLLLLRLAGYAMLGGTLITGAIRLVSDLREIL